MSRATQVYGGLPLDNTHGFRKCCEAVRRSVPIEEVARRYTELETFGGRAWFTGRCPLPDHEDKTPSFYIYPPGRWWCYGCSRGGDVVDLEFNCGDYVELWVAMIALAVEYGVDLPERQPRWYERQSEKQPILAAAEEARKRAFRRRTFRILVLPYLESISNVDERRREIEMSWSEWQEALRRCGR